MVRRSHLLLGVLAVAVLAVPACSGDDGSDGSSGSSGSAGGPATTSAATGTTTAGALPTGEVSQTPPPGANGIKVGPDGDLWIAVIASNEVLRASAETGALLARYPMPEGTGPDDLVLADDGTVFVTGYLSGDVLAIDPESGEVTTVANVGAGANPIAARPDGTLLVGRAVSATGLFAVDPAGEVTPLADPGNVNSFSLDGDVLYGPLTGAGGGSVVAIDPATGEVTRTVAPVAGIPTGLRVHDGTLYVLVWNPTAQVVTVDPTSGAVTPFGDAGLDQADNLAVGSDGQVYVTGFDQPTVTVLGPDGTVERTIPLGSS